MSDQQLTPGPELDARIAEACGVKLISRDEAVRISNEHDKSRPAWDSWYTNEWYVYEEPGKMFFGFTPASSYSIDLDAAFEAAEKTGLFKPNTAVPSGWLCLSGAGSKWGFIQFGYGIQCCWWMFPDGKGNLKGIQQTTPAMAICAAIIQIFSSPKEPV